MPTVISADGTSIAYETAGSGPALVLIDGALCFRDGGPMRGIADRLSEDVTVVLYDRRGRGASTDTVPYSVAREVEDIDALIAATGGSAALFGLSSGGALAITAAVALGQHRVPRLAVYEPPYFTDDATAAAADYTRALAEALAAGDRDKAVALFLRRVGVPDTVMEGMRSSPGWAATIAIAPTLAYDDAALGDSRVPLALLAALRAPLLALAGGQSPAFLRYGAEQLAEHAPEGRFALVDGQTHDIAPAPLASHLVSFLTG